MESGSRGWCLTGDPSRARPAGPAGADGCSRSPAAVKYRLNYILVNIDCGHLLRSCAQKTKTLSPAGPGCCSAGLRGCGAAGPREQGRTRGSESGATVGIAGH